MKKERGFTLVELLIVVAILGVLAASAVIVLNPVELLNQSQDAIRSSDLSTINKAVSLYTLDRAGASSYSLGNADTDYISVPDPAATSTAGDQCQGLGLPALQAPYVYHCAASSTYRLTNGQGWIPIKFNQISAGSPLPILPVDPVNTTSTGFYYVYATDGVVNWELSGTPQSQKFQSQQSDFTAGTNLTLISAVSGNSDTDTNFVAGTFSGAMLSGGDVILDTGALGSTTTYPGTGADPYGIAFDGTNMWTANYSSSSVTKITPSGSVTTYPGTGTGPEAIASDGTNMWTANNGGNSVTKITPSGSMTTYLIGNTPYVIAYDGSGNMWTANFAGTATKINVSTGATTTYSGTGSSPYGIAPDRSGNMWIANYSGNDVIKLNMSTGSTTTYLVGTDPYGIAFDGTNMWIPSSGGSTANSVMKINVTTDTTSTCPGTGLDPQSIAFDGTNMWTANDGGDSVTKVTPACGMTTYAIGTAPYNIAFDGTNMWTADWTGKSVTKISGSGYVSSGNFVSSIISIPNEAHASGTLSWVNTTGQTITMQARSGNATMSTSTAFGSCAISNGGLFSTDPCINNGDAYIQYQASLSTNNGAQTPSLASVTVTD